MFENLYSGNRNPVRKIKKIAYVPVWSKKAGRYEILLGFARSHSVVTRGSTPPHHILPAFLNLNGMKRSTSNYQTFSKNFDLKKGIYLERYFKNFDLETFLFETSGQIRVVDCRDFWGFYLLLRTGACFTKTPFYRNRKCQKNKFFFNIFTFEIFRNNFCFNQGWKTSENLWPTFKNVLFLKYIFLFLEHIFEFSFPFAFKSN